MTSNGVGDDDAAVVGGLLAAVAYLAVGAGAAAGLMAPLPGQAWWAAARVAVGLLAGTAAAGLALAAVAGIWAECRRVLSKREVDMR